jgi:formylglycine-generating enzyme required for sulfatase activity
MAGNVWEWCLNGRGGENGNIMHDSDRTVRGGSFISEANRAQAMFYYSLNPLYRYATIGFRLVCEPAPSK